MKKIAVLMILVLCAVMLGGCMSSGAGSSVADAVAFLHFDAHDDINLTVDKDNKVLVVAYGLSDSSSPVTKDKTVYKDSEFVTKTLNEAVEEIIKANGDKLTALNVKIVSATGKEDAVKSVKEALPKAIEETFIANGKSCDVKITLTLDGKSETTVLEKKANEYIPEVAEDTETEND